MYGLYSGYKLSAFLKHASIGKSAMNVYELFLIKGIERDQVYRLEEDEIIIGRKNHHLVHCLITNLPWIRPLSSIAWSPRNPDSHPA
jgi:hypothetical protein